MQVTEWVHDTLEGHPLAGFVSTMEQVEYAVLA